jgi:hypothetical protein
MLPRAIPSPAVPVFLRKSLRFNLFFIAKPPPVYLFESPQK